MRAGRRDHVTRRQELRAGRQDPPVPGRRPRLDEQHGRRGRGRERDEARLLRRRQLAEHVGHGRQVRGRRVPGSPRLQVDGLASAASRQDRHVAARRLGTCDAAKIALPSLIASADCSRSVIDSTVGSWSATAQAAPPVPAPKSSRLRGRPAGQRPPQLAQSLARRRDGGRHPVGRVRGGVGLGSHDWRVRHLAGPVGGHQPLDASGQARDARPGQASLNGRRQRARA